VQYINHNINKYVRQNNFTLLIMVFKYYIAIPLKIISHSVPNYPYR